MRAGNSDRVKRRVLREAVAENLDVMRGMPPRALRPATRWSRLLTRRAPLLFIAAIVAGTFFMGGGQAIPPVLTQAAVITSRQAALPVLQAAETTESIERMTASAFPLAVRRIVLDAGHGGTDPGASAAQAIEKEITLDIGRRLRGRLESHGFEVVVTRDGDRTIALRDRARLANDSKSDIFVSIHVNALERHTEARGIETYYLGATNDPSLTALAARENRVSGYSVSDMRKLLEGVYADARRDESQQLASAVQKKLYESLRAHDAGLENWGVKRAPFLVLVATDMPAVLAEVGCISNEKESAMLRTPEYRQKIADALFDGIRAYAGANAPLKKGSTQNG
jgi:N-acetylmuramoyl-L-alanine amidase